MIHISNPKRLRFPHLQIHLIKLVGFKALFRYWLAKLIWIIRFLPQLPFELINFICGFICHITERVIDFLAPKAKEDGLLLTSRRMRRDVMSEVEQILREVSE